MRRPPPVLPTGTTGACSCWLPHRRRDSVFRRTSRLCRVALRICLPVAFLAPAGGQTGSTVGQPTSQELAQQIKDLQQHERELLERVAALEANQKSALSPQPVSPVEMPTSATEAAPPDSPPSPQTPVMALEMHSLHGIQWRGFGEVDYKVLNQRTAELGTYGFVPGSAGNFYTGDFDLFLTSRLTDKASVLSEIDFEAQDAQTYKIDLRRMLFKYDRNDHLRISLGRYQTNTGYYNWAFRSASWLQTTADRPLVMEFATDGGILPTQAVGISVTGTIPSGKLGLNYIAEYGSSDTIRPDINNDGLLNDENNGNNINVGLFLSPDSIPGLRIGGSIYHDQISDLVDLASTGQQIGTQGAGSNVPSPSARWNQTIVNGHVIYIAHGFEFLNEGFLIRHAPIGQGETFNTPAFYSQFSKKLGQIRPFFRYQYVNASPQNVIYNEVDLRYGPSFGARYDLNSFLAFKAQLDNTVRRGLPNLNGLHLQLSGTF
jgi:hypothetical protein